MGDVAVVVNLEEGWIEIKTHGLDALEVKRFLFLSRAPDPASCSHATLTSSSSPTQRLMETAFKADKLFENEVKMRVYT